MVAKICWEEAHSYISCNQTCLPTVISVIILSRNYLSSTFIFDTYSNMHRKFMIRINKNFLSIEITADLWSCEQWCHPLGHEEGPSHCCLHPCEDQGNCQGHSLAKQVGSLFDIILKAVTSGSWRGRLGCLVAEGAQGSTGKTVSDWEGLYGTQCQVYCCQWEGKKLIHYTLVYIQ